jgi:hypothetical protein
MDVGAGYDGPVDLFEFNLNKATGRFGKCSIEHFLNCLKIYIVVGTAQTLVSTRPTMLTLILLHFLGVCDVDPARHWVELRDADGYNMW